MPIIGVCCYQYGIDCARCTDRGARQSLEGIMILRKQVAATLATMGLLLPAACQQTVAPVPDRIDTRAADEANVRATVEKWKSVIGQHDMDSILSFYTDDAWQLPASGPIARTAVERREFWRAIETQPIVSEIVDVTDRIEVAQSGDLAVQYGEFRQIISNKAGDTTSVPQKFITTWRKEPDGTWKVSASMATVKN